MDLKTEQYLSKSSIKIVYIRNVHEKLIRIFNFSESMQQHKLQPLLAYPQNRAFQ